MQELLVPEGFEFCCSHDGESGLRALVSGRPDIVILDVMLPDLDGFDVLRQMRESSCVPVIMLTAKGDPADRVAGLEIGADDYICKPFNTGELIARIRAVLRRFEGRMPISAVEPIRIADVSLDPLSRSVSVGDRNVTLTNVEFHLLEYLMVNAGKLARLEQLSIEVLKRKYSSIDRSLSVHMSNLRRKLGRYPGGDERITTVRGDGFIYLFPTKGANEGQ